MTLEDLKLPPQYLEPITDERINGLIEHIKLNAPEFFEKMCVTHDGGINMYDALMNFKDTYPETSRTAAEMFLFFAEWKRRNPKELDISYSNKGIASQADLDRPPYHTTKMETSMLGVFQALLGPNLMVANVGPDRQHIGHVSIIVREN